MSAYRPRTVQSLGLWSHSGFTLKAYSINHDVEAAAALPEAVIAAARARVQQCLADIDTGGHFHAGFVIVHQGAEAVWLLLDWWQAGGVLCQALWRAELSNPTALLAVTQPIVACVWELVVIHHERDAWVRHILTAKPDLPGYLGDRMRDGAW